MMPRLSLLASPALSPLCIHGHSPSPSPDRPNTHTAAPVLLFPLTPMYQNWLDFTSMHDRPPRLDPDLADLLPLTPQLTMTQGRL
jgi:hypothetical protein